jgi:hypothetical protein
MKEYLKNNLLGLVVVTLVSAGVTFAASQNITNTTQTAQTGDAMTPEWVNAVNTKLNAVSAAGSNDAICFQNDNRNPNNVTCVNKSTGRICFINITVYGDNNWACANHGTLDL